MRAEAPGVILIPRYFGLLSRPFLVVPPDFFVAICLCYPRMLGV